MLENGAEDLQGKHQRLCQEYQKVRAQVTVLKKAVIDEQASNKSLQDIVKQKDQSIRKLELDIDSLEFRNSQLSKRVEVLQTDLDHQQGKKNKSQKPPTGNINFIHEQELQLKICENESLHKQLQQLRSETGTSQRSLEARLEILERDKESYEKAIEECNAKNNAVVDRLKEETSLLQVQLHKKEEELKISNILNEKYQKQLEGNHKDLKDQLELSKKLLKEKVSLIDSDNEVLNRLNLPICDIQYKQRVESLVDGLTNHGVVMLAGMSDYHTYLEQKLRCYFKDLHQEEMSPVNEKLCTHLLGNAKQSRQVQQALKSLQEQVHTENFLSLKTLTSFGNLCASFKSYVRYLEQLLSYRELSLAGECAVWSDALEKNSTRLLHQERKVVDVFRKIVSYLGVLNQPDLKINNVSRCIITLCQCLQSLHLSFKELRTVYTEKSDLEKGIPTHTERLKSTDECILSSFASLQSTTLKIHTLFNENKDFMGKVHYFKRKGLPDSPNHEVPSCVKEFTREAVKYMNKVQPKECISVPHNIAVGNYKSFVTSTLSSNSYKEKAESSQEIISKLEQEKEQWLLDNQLIKAKYEKEIKKTALVTEELRKCKTGPKQRFPEENVPNLDRSVSMRSNTSSTSSAPDFHAQLGTVEVIGKDVQLENDNEAVLKDHILTNRITQLNKQLQQADSKCMDFYHEAHSMYKQLVLADLNKQKLSSTVGDANSRVSQLQDELETTKRSYEEQLRMMSDHLCGVNETIAQQKDEIDQLKKKKKKK